ncbi:DNA glycosylase AlkZ-like family protein [Calidifontibacter terrae]
MIELSARDARRLAVRAQLLTAPRPTDPLGVIRHLTHLQADMTAYVAPSADLVLGSRVRDYRPGDLDRLVDDGSVIELRGMLRPAEDLALYLDEMRMWPGPEPWRDWQTENLVWLEANDQGRREVLSALRSDGPLTTAELPNACDVPWTSSGWTDDKTLQALLNMMVQRGEVAVVGREGRNPLWDLASRVYPDVEPVPFPEAIRIRTERSLAALGIMRQRAYTIRELVFDIGPVGAAARIEGVRGKWWVDPELLEVPFRGRTALLSPLDRLIFDRKRMAEIFGFDYQLEMYKPVAKRRWGYFALPVLHGDRLIGKVDAQSLPETGELKVHAIHEDEPFAPSVRESVRRELRGLATSLGLELR